MVSRPACCACKVGAVPGAELQQEDDITATLCLLCFHELPALLPRLLHAVLPDRLPAVLARPACCLETCLVPVIQGDQNFIYCCCLIAELACLLSSCSLIAQLA